LRAFDIAIATLALRTSATQPPKRERRLVPAVDDANPAHLDRTAIPQERAAMVASLWEEARPCAVRPVYAQLPAPAQFSMVYQVTWALPEQNEDARALQDRLAAAFPLTEAPVQVAKAEAA
jgi:hypothetical protein